jgi:DNA-binding PadR family transcriptional regulator
MKHAILGFLVDQPMHGYELKRKLSPALPRERRVNDGVLYPLLRRMEEDGLVRKRVERGQSGRDRNVFHATAQGRREFERWLRSSDDEADEATYDFLVTIRS